MSHQRKAELAGEKDEEEMTASQCSSTDHEHSNNSDDTGDDDDTDDNDTAASHSVLAELQRRAAENQILRKNFEEVWPKP